MSDAARAKAATVKLPYCDGGGACANETGPCTLHIRIIEALDAYAAEQTAKLKSEHAALQGSQREVIDQIWAQTTALRALVARQRQLIGSALIDGIAPELVAEAQAIMALRE
jgi:hypothetical protein